MSTFWSDFVSNLQPYVPGEQPKQQGLIKLNTNENPYPPSPKVQEVLSGDLLDSLRLYPDPDSTALKNALANYYSVNTGNVFIGNGSDEVLALAFMTFFKQGKPLLFPDISYSFYPVYCRLFDIAFQTVSLNEEFAIDIEDYCKENAGVIFPNPNAPTGKVLPLTQIERLLKANTKTVVIVDEAYVDFGADSAVALINRYPNLLVVQTLSKSRSLAGIRIGFAMGSEELIEGLDRVKNSFNSYPIDRLAELAAVAAIEDTEYFENCCRRLIETRNWTTEQLQSLDFDVLPSKANFVFARHKEIDASTLFRELRASNILVRYFNKPRIDQFLRISIGTTEQMHLFVTTMKGIVEHTAKN